MTEKPYTSSSALQRLTAEAIGRLPDCAFHDPRTFSALEAVTREASRSAGESKEATYPTGRKLGYGLTIEGEH